MAVSSEKEDKQARNKPASVGMYILHLSSVPSTVDTKQDTVLVLKELRV